MKTEDLKTMFVGKKYQLVPETRAFPRYKFYRRKLKEVFVRVDNTLEKNKLQDFISQGKQTWAAIQDSVGKCISKTAYVSLYVFASDESHAKNIKGDLIRDKSVINGTKTLPREPIEKKSVQWDSFIRMIKSEFAPEVIVYVKGQHEDERVIKAQMNALNLIQQDRLVIYDVMQKTSFLYKSHKEELDKVLCQNVEFILERNVVLLLEYVEDFISKFIPGRVDLELSSSIIKEKIIKQLQESLDNEHVLKDLLPVESDEDQYAEELNAERLSDFYAKEKKDETLFHIKVRNFISRKAKCEFCDLTAKRLGVPGNFMNEILSEDFFDFEKKFQAKLTSNVLPRWPVRADLKLMFRSTAYFCRTICSELFQEVEKYTRLMFSELINLQKDRFEVHGLLRRSSRAVSTETPIPTQISRILQHDILEVDNVEACGNLYGILTVIVNRQVNALQRSAIETAIKKHNHVSLYEIAVIVEWKEQGPYIEPGGGIICDFIEGGKEKLAAKLQKESKELSENIKGTLGCFVEPTNGQDLYGVTCYHCVDKEYFDINVKAYKGDDQTDIGTRSFSLYHKYTLDIALSKVHDHRKGNCEKFMRKTDGMGNVRQWEFCNKDEFELETYTVFKKGMKTDITEGVIVGSEFKTKHMMELEKNQFKIMTEKDGSQEGQVGEEKDFKEHFNIFIGDGRDSAGHPKDFSEDGDSGSAVCIEEIHEDATKESTVEVVSLLCGSITLVNEHLDENSKKTYSYSCHLRKLLDELTRQHSGCPELKEAIEKEQSVVYRR